MVFAKSSGMVASSMMCLTPSIFNIEKDHGVVANARCMELGEWISLKPSVLVLFPGSYGLLYSSMRV